MLILLKITLLVLLGPASCNDTVADGISSHVMNRLSELLSPAECQSLYKKITGPEKNVVLNLEWSSEGNNPIHSRKRRDITSKDQCKKTLSHWLDAEGDTMYWDRLSQALQAIGRSDVSLELKKNRNQDKSVEIKKNVRGQRKIVHGLEENKIHEQEQEQQDRQANKIMPEKEIKSEFIVAWKSLVPYNRSLLGWDTPVVVGVFSGLVSSYVLVALALYSYIWFLNEGRTESFLEKMLPPYFPLPQGGAVYYMYQQFDESGNDDTEPASGDDDDCSSWYEEFLFQS